MLPNAASKRMSEINFSAIKAASRGRSLNLLATFFPVTSKLSSLTFTSSFAFTFSKTSLALSCMERFRAPREEPDERTEGVSENADDDRSVPTFPTGDAGDSIGVRLVSS